MSQQQISNVSIPATPPRPRKRPRPVIVIDDDINGTYSKASPSKPSRLPYSRAEAPPLFLFSDSEDDIEPSSAALLNFLRSSQPPRPPSHIPCKSRLLSEDLVNQRSARLQTDQLLPVLDGSHLDVNHVEADTEPIKFNVNCLPDDFDYPSPPPSSSNDSQDREPGHYQPASGGASATADKPPLDAAESFEKAPPPVIPRRPRVVDTFEPSVLSQDSAYFSFSRLGSREQAVPSSNLALESAEISNPREELDDDAVAGLEPVQRRYYTAAFEYVIAEVLKRYSDILRPYDLDLVSQLQKQVPNSLALFVRMYRRKPGWHRAVYLKRNYEKDIDVDKAISELYEYRLVVSSRLALKDPEKALRAMLAKEVLSTCKAKEARAMCNSVSDGHKFKKLPQPKLLSTLRGILSEGWTASACKKKRQTTLTGMSQAECLANAVLRTAGHCVHIPKHILVSLQRIHFLFFLEDGHDSPNVILGDIGKVKFPSYECQPKGRIFPSSCAFEGFEAATRLEKRLNNALEAKDFNKAADLGSIAELEVREYLSSQGCTGFPSSDELAAGQCFSQHSNTARSMSASLRTARAKASLHRDIVKQLQHPFFRRFTAHWVYARAAWHSVHALERLNEHENAVNRLELLLSTGLVTKRRGKFLNRLTINLHKHLGRSREALDLILDALAETSPSLHLGDRMGLANRGINIHRKLAMPEAERKAMNASTTKSGRRKIAVEDVISTRPPLLTEVISRVGTKVRMRRIYGKSIQVSERDRRRKTATNITDPWLAFRDEGSRDSIRSESAQDESILGKSVFLSMGTAHHPVSVEQYCLEWYLGKDGWLGVHDEGASVRFLYCLLFWECALFANIDDVFQTPYQDKPLDLFTEAYYSSRKEAIEDRIKGIEDMSATQLRDTTRELYEKYDDTRAVGCDWQRYSAEDLSHVAAGIGGWVLSRCCQLLSEDYSYWGGGLPDLTLWKTDGPPNAMVFSTKFVEVKSARDTLSEKQRAWLLELELQGADCEVCKVVEKVTAQNAAELEDSTLSSIAISAIDEWASDDKINI